MLIDQWKDINTLASSLIYFVYNTLPSFFLSTVWLRFLYSEGTISNHSDSQIILCFASWTFPTWNASLASSTSSAARSEVVRLVKSTSVSPLSFSLLLFISQLPFTLTFFVLIARFDFAFCCSDAYWHLRDRRRQDRKILQIAICLGLLCLCFWFFAVSLLFRKRYCLIEVACANFCVWLPCMNWHELFWLTAATS